MPSSTASVKPSLLTPSANSVSSGACSSIFSVIVSQPRRLAISGTPGPPQSDSSFCQTRLATRSDQACSTRWISAGSSSSGIEDSIVAGRPVTIPSRVSSMPAISLSNGSTNLSIPSLQQLLGHVVHVDAGVGQGGQLCARILVGRGAVDLDCSSQASSVAIGIVLTVCGATSESTYLVSG